MIWTLAMISSLLQEANSSFNLLLLLKVTLFITFVLSFMRAYNSDWKEDQLVDMYNVLMDIITKLGSIFFQKLSVLL